MTVPIQFKLPTATVVFFATPVDFAVAAIIETIPVDARGPGVLIVRNEGTVGDWLLTIGGTTRANWYCARITPLNSFALDNPPVGPISLQHTASGDAGAGRLHGLITYSHEDHV